MAGEHRPELSEITQESNTEENPNVDDSEEAPKWLNDWEKRQRELVREEVRAGLSEYHAALPPGNQAEPTPPPSAQSSDEKPDASPPPEPMPAPPKPERKEPPENPPPPPPRKWGFSKTTRRRPK